MCRADAAIEYYIITIRIRIMPHGCPHACTRCPAAMRSPLPRQQCRFEHSSRCFDGSVCNLGAAFVTVAAPMLVIMMAMHSARTHTHIHAVASREALIKPATAHVATIIVQ